MSDLYQKENHPDGVRAICKECETVVLKDTETEAWSVVEEHNDAQHDGEDVAGVCQWDVPNLAPDMGDISADNIGALIELYGPDSPGEKLLEARTGIE